MLSKKPIVKSTLVPKDQTRDDYTDKTLAYGLHGGQSAKVKIPSQSSGGSIEGNSDMGQQAATVSMKTVPKNMRIRETPIRVRKAGINKVMIKKNSNSILDEVQEVHNAHSMATDDHILRAREETAKSDEQLMLKKQF